MVKSPINYSISFRATLFTLMMAVLLTAVVLLGSAGYIYARFAVGNLGYQVLEQETERVNQHVQHALDIAEGEASTITTLIDRGLLTPDDHARITEHFIASLNARPSLSYLSIGTPSGKYYHGFRDQDGNLSALWLLPQENGQRNLLEFKLEPSGEREVIRDIKNSIRTPAYERPYFTWTRDAGRPIWTESFVFLGSGESLDVPGVSRAIPLFDSADERFKGVLTADFDLHALSRFLSKVDLGADGLCFLVEIAANGTPRVIAHPGAANPDPDKRIDLTQPAPDGEGRVTVSADQVPDPRVVSALSALGSDLSSVPRTFLEIDVDVSGQQYIGGFCHLGREDGPDWLICMLIPEEAVFGDVRRMAIIMMWVGIGGVVVAGSLSLILARRVSVNLGCIAEETREIGRFELTPKSPIKSRIEEIRTLAGAVEEMKTSLRSFQKFVPSELVRQLLESGQEAKLGGSRKELTVYFSDIVGFTSISEKLRADQLVKLLSEYLEEMTAEVLKNGGTVDKYIGDAIMAFWGAPRPCEQHANEACRTALANQARLSELREVWKKANLPPLESRIGLHTGAATVGNFGSPNRLDYTAIGDTVNVASRLEGLNRIYGTQILISETTKAAIGQRFITRPLDHVAVKGREQGMTVFELIGGKDSSSQSEYQWIEEFSNGLNTYLSGDWMMAIVCFERVLQSRPDDHASQLMIERCRIYNQTPPPADWNGVFYAPK